MLSKHSFVQFVPSALFILSISYLSIFIERSQSTLLVSTYCVAFLAYIFIPKSEGSFNLLVGVGLLARLMLLFSLPSLSDDLYRFIWDGTLLKNGIHPFEHLPGYYLDKGVEGINQKLFDRLNSADYFTIYPPLNQFIFWLSAMIGGSNWLIGATVIRLFLFVGDLGAFFFLQKLLRHYEKDSRLAFWYFLNPLVILEFTGNLHFEGVVVCFLLMGVYFYERAKKWSSALFLGLAIGTKLLPLIYLPYFFIHGLRKKTWAVAIAAGIIALVTLLPLLNEHFINGMQSSLDLYFRRFEFNASMYYLAREVGYLVYGYNNIAVIGPFLSVVSFISILLISVLGVYKKWRIPQTLLLILTCYLLFTTTVHPWYTLPLVALGLLCGGWYPVAWSFFIFITYVGYTKVGFHLPLYAVVLEYLMLFLFMLMERNSHVRHRVSDLRMAYSNYRE
ncbi:MAG: glycosyltransferase family 87 protein [Bacteroidota bacterium]